MAVSSKTPDDITKDIETDGYPKLMISKSKQVIVLVTGRKAMPEKERFGLFGIDYGKWLLIGTVINSNSIERPVGYVGEDFIGNKFTNYNKEVILKNC